jgi:CRP-like cAMP-binding protein
VYSSLQTKSCWNSYLKYAERRFYKRKSVVYLEKQQEIQGFYYLEKGLVKVSAICEKETEQIIDIVSKGKSFGEHIVDGEVYFSTATAIVDSVIYFFPLNCINYLMETEEGFRSLFYESLTEKLKTLSTNVLFRSLPSEKLLAKTILGLQEKFVSNTFPFTQRELCHCTNLKRTTVYQIMKKWDNNIVSLDKKSLIIHNNSKLEEIAAL